MIQMFIAGLGMIHLPPVYVSSLSHPRRTSLAQKSVRKTGFRICSAVQQPGTVSSIALQTFFDTVPPTEKEAIERGRDWLEELRQYYISYIDGEENSLSLALEDLLLDHLPDELKGILREIQTRIAVERAKSQRLG